MHNREMYCRQLQTECFEGAEDKVSGKKEIENQAETLIVDE